MMFLQRLAVTSNRQTQSLANPRQVTNFLFVLESPWFVSSAGCRQTFKFIYHAHFVRKCFLPWGGSYCWSAGDRCRITLLQYWDRPWCCEAGSWATKYADGAWKALQFHCRSARMAFDRRWDWDGGGHDELIILILSVHLLIVHTIWILIIADEMGLIYILICQIAYPQRCGHMCLEELQRTVSCLGRSHYSLKIFLLSHLWLFDFHSYRLNYYQHLYWY